MSQPLIVFGGNNAPPPSVDIPIVFFSIAICVLGLFGNLIVILGIVILREHKKSVTHWYVLQLAIADSLFLLTLPFKVNEDLYGNWNFPDWMCKAKETILFLNYYASMLFLVIMSVDRYIAVCHAFSNTTQKLRTKTSALAITTAVWFVSFLCCIPVMQYSFKIGVAPQCFCSYEFPKPVKNNTADCLAEKFLSLQELEFCLFISRTPQIDNGEPFCQQFDIDTVFNSLRSGSIVNESGEGMNVFTELFSEEDQFLAELESGEAMSGFDSSAILGNYIPESSGNDFQNQNIPVACHYWEHPIGWKVFVSVNFLVAFVLPFFIMLVSYGLIIKRLSQPKVRTSEESIRSRKKKAPSKASKDRKKVTKMCAALVSCFLICWLPFHTIHLAKLFGIPTTKDVCVLVPKIGALLAHLNSALNPYLYSFLGTSFSKRWKLFRNSSGMQQFVSLATRKQNEHSSNEGQRGEKGKTAKRRTAQYSSSQQPSSDNEISLHRPTLAAKISNQCETIQGTPSTQTSDLRPSSSPKITQDSAVAEVLLVIGEDQSC